MLPDPGQEDCTGQESSGLCLPVLVYSQCLTGHWLWSCDFWSPSSERHFLCVQGTCVRCHFILRAFKVLTIKKNSRCFS